MRSRNPASGRRRSGRSLGGTNPASGRGKGLNSPYDAPNGDPGSRANQKKFAASQLAQMKRAGELAQGTLVTLSSREGVYVVVGRTRDGIRLRGRLGKYGDLVVAPTALSHILKPQGGNDGNKPIQRQIEVPRNQRGKST